MRIDDARGGAGFGRSMNTLHGWRHFAAYCAVLALVLTGCGGSSTQGGGNSAKGKTIQVVFYTEAIPYFQEQLKGLQAEAQVLGVNLKVSSANFDAAQEASLMENAITQHPDGIILAPIDREALVPVSKKAEAAGIPVVLVGDNFGNDGQDAMLTFVGLDTKQYGIMKADFIAKRLNGKGQVIVIHGPRGLDYVEAQRVGYDYSFNDYPNIQVVEGPYGNFASEVGLASLENVLSRYPQPNAVYFDNDDLAIGGLRALQERGIAPSSVVTISSDGAPAAIADVQSGTLTGTVATRPYATGVKALQVITDYLSTHQAPAKLVNVQPVLVTKESLASLKPEDYR
jgi:ABC-type sugar transport system substrate-binding protein